MFPEFRSALESTAAVVVVVVCEGVVVGVRPEDGSSAFFCSSIGSSLKALGGSSQSAVQTTI